jgi:hypothetical protein
MSPLGGPHARTEVSRAAELRDIVAGTARGSVSEAPHVPKSTGQGRASRAASSTTWVADTREERSTAVDGGSHVASWEDGAPESPVSAASPESNVEQESGEPTPEGTPSTTPTSPSVEGEQVTVCHKPDGGQPKTMVLSVDAVESHLAHGDTSGACPDEIEDLVKH